MEGKWEGRKGRRGKENSKELREDTNRFMLEGKAKGRRQTEAVRKEKREREKKKKEREIA